MSVTAEESMLVGRDSRIDVPARRVQFEFFAIPLLLGGRRVQMMGVAIRDMISPLFNWSGAAAAGTVLILLTVLVLVVSAWLVRITTQKTGG